MECYGAYDGTTGRWSCNVGTSTCTASGLLEVQDHVCSGEGGSYCWICILCLLCQFWLSPQDLCTIILGYSVCEEEGVDGYLASVFAEWHTAMHHEATPMKVQHVIKQLQRMKLPFLPGRITTAWKVPRMGLCRTLPVLI